MLEVSYVFKFFVVQRGCDKMFMAPPPKWLASWTSDIREARRFSKISAAKNAIRQFVKQAGRFPGNERRGPFAVVTFEAKADRYAAETFPDPLKDLAEVSQ